MALLFRPLSIGFGFLAGLIAKRLFDAAWGLIDEEEPPDKEHRDISLAKLALALAIEGAIFRLVRGFADHYLRRGWYRLTGAWPGEERPEPE